MTGGRRIRMKLERSGRNYDDVTDIYGAIGESFRITYRSINASNVRMFITRVYPVFILLLSFNKEYKKYKTAKREGNSAEWR
ncbi:hypothetical protein C922_04450 [Plasmodium inui San Antonio 1]|uniref:Uncharacterized protein n=1 Tax=Plasmodium inui San Antonio 1 TaxID=1237626 RepID=W7A7S2_9APIC|nr:hypothetical protein C922_04450 [Plasmodium inui San Antonio 1]EUD65164.1 hypothetical protein C922_04450 [Plasmodium inui San Antonio 1]